MFEYLAAIKLQNISVTRISGDITKQIKLLVTLVFLFICLRRLAVFLCLLEIPYLQPVIMLQSVIPFVNVLVLYVFSK